MKQLWLLIMPFFLLSCDSEGTQNARQEEPEPVEEESLEADALLNSVLDKSFSGIVNVQKNSKTYLHLLELAEEAVSQAAGKTKHGLPLLYQEKNFPTEYNYYTGSQTNIAATYKTIIGWLAAMQLSELCPAKRNALYKAGYEAGGYNMKSNIYGYHFMTDPNVARLVASAVYAAMHSSATDTETMRSEVGGSKYTRTLAALFDDEPRVNVTDDAFYVDLRRFMASAPGPYAPGYTDRSALNPTFSDDKASNGCLNTDMAIFYTVFEQRNLPDERTLQAVADKDGDTHHLFGSDKHDIGGMYDFTAVFGAKTIGEFIEPDGKIASFIELVQNAGSSARGILQHANPSVGATEYGRLRPGCSEQQECVRRSFSDDRLNVLASFLIEDNDGNKETYEEDGIEVFYYDENGEWTNDVVQTEEEYEDMVKDLLYANSYPSGHASGIWSAAMTLIEIYPKKADLIMRAANDFALSRVISRYHWNSDVIQGKVIGSIMNPVCHAASDYFTLLESAKAR